MTLRNENNQICIMWSLRDFLKVPMLLELRSLWGNLFHVLGPRKQMLCWEEVKRQNGIDKLVRDARVEWSWILQDKVNRLLKIDGRLPWIQLYINILILRRFTSNIDKVFISLNSS